MDLDHVQLAAPPDCEAAAHRFFGELLGLDEVQKPTALAGRGGVWFALGGGRQLHVGVVGVVEFAPALKAHPAFRMSTTEALDQLAAALTDADHPVSWAVPGEIPGLLRFFSADPWGNRLEFLAPLASTD